LLSVLESTASVANYDIHVSKHHAIDVYTVNYKLEPEPSVIFVCDIRLVMCDAGDDAVMIYDAGDDAADDVIDIVSFFSFIC
jgi:hypothetical protein